MTESNTQNVEKSFENPAPELPTANSAKATKATKAEKLLKLLKSKRGATIGKLQEASGWQAHSVRGFLSGTVKKRMGLALACESDKQGVRRYRIADTGKPAAK